MIVVYTAEIKSRGFHKSVVECMRTLYNFYRDTIFYSSFIRKM